MRIGIFTDFYKPSINGVTNSVENFRVELEKRGHEVFIFAPNIPGYKKERKVYRLPSVDEFSPKNSPIAIPIMPIISRVIKPLKLDIIHTQIPFPVGYLGHRAAQKLNIPEVHTYHTHLTEYAHYFPSEILQPLVKFGLKKIVKVFCNNCDVVVAPSTAIKDLLKSYGVRSPIIVNQSGIKLNEFRKLTPEEKHKLFSQYQIPENENILLFAGRLAPEKNILFLINTFRKIIKTEPETYLIIAGGGPSEEMLRQKVTELGLENQVKITGFLEKELMSKFFGAADIFVFPSLTETQGLVICEALASELPVVAINAMGQKDLIKNNVNGFLVANRQVDFAEKILDLIHRPSLRNRIIHAAKISSKQFSVEKRTDKLISIYQKTIVEHKAHHHSTILSRLFDYFK